jgi:DNA-binding CsgD family transcriptional regulator
MLVQPPLGQPDLGQPDLGQPKLSIECGDLFWKQMTASVLKDSLGTWRPTQPMLLIVDEPWGYAFNFPETDKVAKVILTRNPCKEYWEDLQCRLHPSVLLAGEQTPESLSAGIQLAGLGQSLKMTPLYQIDLTAKELEVLHHLARIKTDKQIAVIMGITAGTVANHLNRITKKLGLCGREEAGLYYWGMSEIAKNLKG